MTVLLILFVAFVLIWWAGLCLLMLEAVMDGDGGVDSRVPIRAMWRWMRWPVSLARYLVSGAITAIAFTIDSARQARRARQQLRADRRAFWKRGA